MSRRVRLYRRHRKDKVEDTAHSIGAQHAHKGQLPMKGEKIARIAAALHRARTR